MKQVTTYACEKCGETFVDRQTAEGHESTCLSLAVGQRVAFMFELCPCEGRITALNPPKTTSGKPTVDLETDTVITDVDQWHDGKHVWVTRDNIVRILSC